MMLRSGKFLHELFFFVTLITLIVPVTACTPGTSAILPPAVDSDPTASPTATATYVLAPPDATATSTPFQPIPPTAVYMPTDTPTPTFTPEPTATATEATWSAPEGFLLEEPKGNVNILLLGADRRPGQSQFRTDTIVLLTLNSKLGTVNLTSFPRDMWIDLPGYGPGRINTAYTFGKFKMLDAAFKQNFGVDIDHHVLINFHVFKQIIDGLGGLDVKVGQQVADYRAGYWTKIPKGKVFMDADAVLWYVRTRKTTNDIQRNRRQQEVLMAIAEKLFSLDGVRRAPELYATYSKNVTTDISLLDVLSWIPLAVKVYQNDSVKSYYIDYHHLDNWITPDGAMVLVPKMSSVMEVIRKSQNLK